VPQDVAPVRVPSYEKRSDWYIISDKQAEIVGHAPLIFLDGKRGIWVAHRSHLPLLGTEPRADALPPVCVRSELADGTTLRDYQEVGAEFIGQRRGTLLADNCRLGKTAQIVAAHDPASGSMVVIGPLAVRGVWLDWWRRRWPEIEPVVLTGRKYDPDTFVDHPLVFAHYDILPSWTSLGLRDRIGTLVLDEVHVLSNPKSKRSIAALMMSPAAEHVVCATGTPLWNKPAGLWSILSICNPAAWGSFKEFTAAYCSGAPGPYGWTTGAPSRVEEFQTRLEAVMLRRRWRDIRDELPPCTRTVEIAPLNANQILQIDKLAESIREELSQGADFSSPTLIGALARVRRLVAARKAPIAASAACRVADSGERVVVWVWHKKVADTIARRIKRATPYVVTGSVPERNRARILDEWRASENGVLIISMGVAPAGIDLSQAAHCIFAELDWTPATIGQAEMRTFSPSRPNFVTFVVAEHDIDQRLVDTLTTKCEMAAELGVPAMDTAGDVMQEVFARDVAVVDLASLANRISARVALPTQFAGLL